MGIRRLVFHLACGLLVAAPCVAQTDDGARLNLGRAPIPMARIRVLTLDAAYDRAVSSDQSIGIAYLQAKINELLKWRALTRMEPRMNASLGWSRTDEDRDRTGRAVGSTNLGGTGVELKNSVNSSFVPKRTAESSDLSGQQRTGTSTPFDSVTRDTRGAGGNVVFEQPLLDLSVFPAWRSGKISAQAARLECQFVVREVLFGVARAYYDVLRAEAVAGIDRQTVELSEQQLAIAQKRFDAGDALRTDVLRAQAGAESARRQAVDSSTAVRHARSVLSSLLNLPPGVPYGVVEPEKAAKESGTPESAANRAYVLREDYRVSALMVDREYERRREVDATFLPKVSAQVRAGWLDETGSSYGDARSSEFTQSDRTSTGTILDPATGQFGPSSSFTSNRRREDFSGRETSHSSSSTSSWEALVVFQMPAWGRNTVDRRERSLEINQAVLQHQQVAKQVQQEVTDAWLEVDRLRQTLKSLEAEVAALDQSYRDLQNQYEAGTATILDTQVALRELNAARTMKTAQTYEYEIALRQTQRVTGEFQQKRVAAIKFR